MQPGDGQSSSRGLIAWFAHNHVAANLLMLLILLVGGFSAFSIEKQTFPNFEIDSIRVTVPYLGAAPQEVEEGVLLKIEEALESIEGIDEIISTANEGSADVRIDVATGYEIGDLMDEVKLAIDGISSFPGETERPIIQRVRFTRGGIRVQVYGDLEETQLKRFADQVRGELLGLPEVSSAELQGARDFEIAVEISEASLRQYNLTLDSVARAINRWSLDLPGGSIRSAAGTVRLRTNGQAYTADEFEQIVLFTTADGVSVRVGDIGIVRDGFVEVESYAFFNGKPSFGVQVQAVGEQNELEVTQAVRDYVAERKATLPSGVAIEHWADSSFYLQGRMTMMLKNMALGAMLVFVILGVFLHLKMAAWVIVGLPVAFLGAMMFMTTPLVGVSLNVISLFAFILVLGIVVDDAIIVAESAFAETERFGYSAENVVRGAQRVAVPATFGVLTTIMAFLPLLFTTGPAAAFTGAIAWVVVLCLAFALIESKLILPSHLALMGSSHQVPKSPKRDITGYLDRKLRRFIERVYRPFLQRAINRRYVTMASFIALLIVTLGVVAGGQVRFVFFPEVDSDEVVASVNLVEGVPEAQIYQVVEEMSAGLRRADEALSGNGPRSVEHVFAYVDNGKTATFRVELVKEQAGRAATIDIEREWRRQVGEIAGTRDMKFVSTRNISGGPPVAFTLQGDDYASLEQAAAQLQAQLREISGLYEVETTVADGPSELKLRIRPEAETVGVSLADLAGQVREAFFGAEAQRIQRGDQEVKVMVRYPRAERESIGNLESMWVRLDDGREIPFGAIADYTQAEGYNSIRRIDAQRSVTVTAKADVSTIEPAEVMRQFMAQNAPRLEANYPGVRVKVGASVADAVDGELSLYYAFAIGLFGIYALMAIPLRSYIQPLLIMGVIPFGIVGAVFGHLVLGEAISMISLVGIIALSGVVVNDSLIMVDFVNRGVAEGKSTIQSAMDSGAVRFRAILLTSMTTFFGLVPMLLETSLQAKIVIPMAISMAFGILFATVITLLLVPCLYVIQEDFKRALGRLVGRSHATQNG